MSGIGGTPTSAALDQFLRDSYDVVQAVHRELDSIKAVASHLTPVEDLIEFQNEVVALHAKLGVLVYASELLAAATDAGVALLIAPDAPAQRALLELKSAALEEASFFATATAFDSLAIQVGTLSDNLDAALLVLANKVDRDELNAALAGIGTRLDGIEGDLGTGVGVVDARVDELIAQLQDGTFVSASAVALEALTTRVTQAEAGITATSQRTTVLESKVTNLQTGAAGQANALNQLTTRVTANETGVTSLATNVLALTTQASNLADGQTAQSAAIQNLSSRTTVTEGQIDAQATALTQLDAKATDAKNQATAAASAISGLEVRVQSGEAGQLVLASDISQLDARVTDTETGLQAQAQATNALMARVTDTEQGLDIAGEERTVLRASLTGTGNYLPNTAFSVGLRGWQLFSRGDGWLDAVLERNAAPTLPNALPESMFALSLTQDEVPSGSAGIRCSNIPVQDLASYILSGYIAAENCTVRLEWRLFNAADEEIGLGVVGTTTKAPTARLSDWDRPWGVIDIPADGVYLQVHVWVVDCNTGFPKAWLIRPMLEPRTEGMEGPSPWMDGMAGVEETYATAVQSLETRVTETEDGLDVLAQSITDLTAVIGGSQEWRITHHSGSGDFISVGSPMSPGIRKATSVVPSYNLTRGLTVLRFDAQNALLSATPFDTYSNVAERNALRDLLMSFTEQDTFLLVSQNHHGIKQADLTAALERCGALLFKDVVGSRPYVLAGRGLAGAGGGIEYVAPANAQWQDVYITTVNGVPKGMGTGMSEVISGQASAIDSLTAQVTTQGGAITSLSSQVTELTADVASVQSGISAQGAALSDLGVRVSSTEAGVSSLSSSVTTLSGRMDQANTDIAAQGSAISGLSTRMTSAEGSISSISTDVTELEAAVTGVLDDVDALGTASSQLGARVDAVEGTVTGISNNVTTLSGRVGATETDLVAQGDALDSLTTRVTSNEDLLASQVAAVTAISAELSAVGGTNLLPNAGMEEGITPSRPRHWIASNTAGVSAVESRVSSTLTQSQWAYRLYHAALAKNAYLGVYSHNGDGEAFPKIEGSKPYVLSSNIRATPGMELRIYFQARDALGAVLQTVASEPVNGTGGYRRIELRIPSTHPEAVSCSVHAGRVINTTAGTAEAYIEVDNVQLQEGVLATAWEPSILYGDKVMASAVDSLTTRVSDAEGTLTSMASAQTALASRVGDMEGALVNEIITSANKDAVHTASINQLTARMTDAEGDVAAAASAISGLDTRVASAEGTLSSHSSSLVSLQSQVNALDLDAGGSGAAIAALDTRVTATEDQLESQGSAITSLQNSVTNANKVFVQNTAPPTAGRTINDLWVHTGENNRLYAFDGTTWVARPDNNKNKIFVQSSAPTGAQLNDLWVNTGDNNKLHRWNGTTWVDATDTRIAANATAITGLTTRVTTAENSLTSQGNAITTLQNTVNHPTTGVDATATGLTQLTTRVSSAESTLSAQSSQINLVESSLSTKAQVFVQATAPSSTGRVNGDVWIDTANGNKFYIWNGAWTLRNIEAGLVIFAQTTTPPTTGRRVGDMWYKTNENNAPYRWNGSSWQSMRDPRVGNHASAIDYLDTRVDDVEGVVSAQATSISQLTTTVNGNTASITQQGTSINGLKAQYGVIVDVNGYAGGFTSVNNGNTVSFLIDADKFAVSKINGSSGLYWENNTFWNKGTSNSFISGHGFGTTSDLLLFVGPTPTSPAAAVKDDAAFYVDTSGNARFSGILYQSIITGSAMELGSTRIHTGGGRLAPFTVREFAYKGQANGQTNFSATVTLPAFVSANSGSGYNSRRLSRNRSDVILSCILHGDGSGGESVYIDVQYDGGAWNNIANRTGLNVDYRGGFTLLVRYTTFDAWTTVAFRARTTNGNTICLAFSALVDNTYETGNSPASVSGMDSSSGTGGTPPPSGGGGDGGGTYCVDYATTRLPDGRYVNSLQVGDLVECVDVRTNERSLVPLAAMDIGNEECFLVLSEHGSIIQSGSTPMDMADGSVVLTRDLDGHVVLSRDHGWEKVAIFPMGVRTVCKPDFGDRMFFAGMWSDKTIATHNIRMKEAL